MRLLGERGLACVSPATSSAAAAPLGDGLPASPHRCVICPLPACLPAVRTWIWRPCWMMWGLWGCELAATSAAAAQCLLSCGAGISTPTCAAHGFAQLNTLSCHATCACCVAWRPRHAAPSAVRTPRKPALTFLRQPGIALFFVPPFGCFGPCQTWSLPKLSFMYGQIEQTQCATLQRPYQPLVLQHFSLHWVG